VQLDAGLERRRRLRTLLITVPSLLNQHLAPVLKSHRWTFMAGLLRKAPAYRRSFARRDDDVALTAVKRTFLFVGVLYNELAARVGEDQALGITQAFLYELACDVQRRAYVDDAPALRSWDRLHDAHEAQMAEGLISANESGGIVRSGRRVSLNIVRCRFHECFRDMGNAAITEAFCRSDETVFNAYLPEIRFHRGAERPDTIARGAKSCAFVFERSPRVPVNG